MKVNINLIQNIMSNKEVLQAVKINEVFETLNNFDINEIGDAIHFIQDLYKNDEEIDKAWVSLCDLQKIIYLSMEICAKEMKELSNK